MEEASIEIEAASFSRAVRRRGAIREFDQQDGLSWWERAGQRIIEAMSQARALARDLWRRMLDRNRDLGPDR
jgi:hypothetical protein